MNMLNKVAEALWQAESLRAAGFRRRTEWAAESEATHERWRFAARAAVEAMRKLDDLEMATRAIEVAGQLIRAGKPTTAVVDGAWEMAFSVALAARRELRETAT